MASEFASAVASLRAECSEAAREAGEAVDEALESAKSAVERISDEAAEREDDCWKRFENEISKLVDLDGGVSATEAESRVRQIETRHRDEVEEILRRRDKELSRVSARINFSAGLSAVIDRDEKARAASEGRRARREARAEAEGVLWRASKTAEVAFPHMDGEWHRNWAGRAIREAKQVIEEHERAARIVERRERDASRTRRQRNKEATATTILELLEQTEAKMRELDSKRRDALEEVERKKEVGEETEAERERMFKRARDEVDGIWKEAEVKIVEEMTKAQEAIGRAVAVASARIGQATSKLEDKFWASHGCRSEQRDRTAQVAGSSHSGLACGRTMSCSRAGKNPPPRPDETPVSGTQDVQTSSFRHLEEDMEKWRDAHLEEIKAAQKTVLKIVSTSSARSPPTSEVESAFRKLSDHVGKSSSEVRDEKRDEKIAQIRKKIEELRNLMCSAFMGGDDVSDLIAAFNNDKDRGLIFKVLEGAKPDNWASQAKNLSKEM